MHLGFAAFALLIAADALCAQRTRASSAPTGQATVDLPQPGNVLVLLADDLGVDQLGFYAQGSDHPPTPNLDVLAAGGVVFRNAWSEPTCSPTRAALMTGRHGFRHGIGVVVNPFADSFGLRASEVTLPEMLDLGTGGRYAHALIGKWHLTPFSSGDLAPNAAGWSHFAGSIEGQITNYEHWRRVVDGVAAISTRYATSAAVDDALAWIGEQDGRWLCFVSFQAPHAPFHAPPAGLHTQTLPSGPPQAGCGGTGNDPRPYYEAMVEALDTEIGRLLASLPASELARTTVLFLADNGSERCVASSSSDRAKGTLYQGGVNVPLIAWGHRVGRGVSDALVTTSDLFATVAELAGVDLASTLPGHELDSISFAPALASPGVGARDVAYAELFTPNGAGSPLELPPCPAVPVCQPDLGFDGPGDVVLAVCGEPLYGVYGANVVPWKVTGGPPHAAGTLRIGTYSPMFDIGMGAFLVSNPPAHAQPFVLDANGGRSATLWTPDASRELHYQVVVSDPAQPNGFAVSNAIRIDPLWTDMRAARDRRYKLIRRDPCSEELYDLATDPLETADLLPGGLTAVQREAYDRLAAVLDGIR